MTMGNPVFGHQRDEVQFWGRLEKQSLSLAPTPFYLFSTEPISQALEELRVIEKGLPIPVRHWLSCKTQPVRPLLNWWRRRGGSIEVVSEFEFLAALKEGFPPERILVNGPAKNRWLPRQSVRGILVNFDSWNEAQALLPLAKKLDWTVGVRCHTGEEFDPEHSDFPTQFGMQADEAVAALRNLKRADVRLEIIHFHLRTNVRSPQIYARAIDEVARICEMAKFNPKYLDCGGGYPPHHVVSHGGHRYDAEFDLVKLSRAYEIAARKFPDLRELWLENGRFVSARSGVLVMRVWDVKERKNLRQLICDGGRTMNALISSWEMHEIFSVPKRGGPTCLIAVCGPTCMAFDQRLH